VLVLIAIANLAACVTAGNGKMKVLTQHSTAQLLTPGKTTRAEVAQQLGEGKALRFDSGYEVWVYEFAQGIPRFVDFVPYIGHVSRSVRHSGKELRVLFDSQGVVRKYLLLDITVGDSGQPTQ
jgi:hypothetical protein